jgi:hypothetical protein
MISHKSGIWLSVPYRLGTLAYRLQDNTRSRACIHTLSCVMQLRTSPPYRGGLRCYHVSCSSRPRIFAKESFDAVMCPTVLDPASLLGRAPALLRIPQFPVGRGPQV